MKKILGYLLLTALVCFVLYMSVLLTGWQYTVLFFSVIAGVIVFAALSALAIKLITGK